jgi:hypothetical protein
MRIQSQQAECQQIRSDEPAVMGVVAIGALALWITGMVQFCLLAIPMLEQNRWITAGDFPGLPKPEQPEPRRGVCSMSVWFARLPSRQTERYFPCGTAYVPHCSCGKEPHSNDR